MRALGAAWQVDVDAWALEYGTEATPAAVRADVLTYLRHAADNALSPYTPAGAR